MSRGVDVLAVMDEAAQEIATLADAADIEGNPYDLQEARAAVDELIESAESARYALQDGTHKATRAKAMAELRAALARCQPKGD